MATKVTAVDANARLVTAQDDKAAKLITWYADMEAQMGTWKTTWQKIADYVVPRKDNIQKKTGEGLTGDIEQLYNTTAMESATIHAGGEMDYMFSGRFFTYQAPKLNGEDPSDEAKQYFAKCTEITLDELLKSNFLLEVHEMLYDRVDFGTADLYCEEKADGDGLQFANDRVGSYGIAEGPDKIVNTIIRKLDMTCAQAVDKFGIDNVGETIRQAYQSGDLTKRNARYEFLHAIYPRPASERKEGAVDGPNKAIASEYVDLSNKVMCRVSGYDEMPMAVTRYLKWQKDPYGYSPSMIALPTSRQVNFIERCMDALAETMAFPRVLIPDNLDGNDVDFRASGQTVYDANRPEAMPKEWLTQGRYDIGMERIKTKDDLIKRLYLVDLWQMLAQIDREMTAYEVQQRLAEKITGITPAFHRMTTEFFNPMLKRIFGVLYRQGKFPQPPAELLKPDPKDPLNPVKATLMIPQITLTGKLAMAIRSAEQNAFMTWANMMMPLAQVMGPEVLDAVDFPKASKGSAMTLGVPVRWQRNDADMRKLKQQRDQAAQQAQSQQAALAASQSAKNLGGAPQALQDGATTAMVNNMNPNQK